MLAIKQSTDQGILMALPDVHTKLC